MTPEAIKTEADRIVEMYLPYAKELDFFGNDIEKQSATRCAIIHIEGLIVNQLNTATYWDVVAGEWYVNRNKQLQLILTELKSRV